MDNIILYSTGCPQCKILTKKLEEKHIPFIVNSDEEKMAELQFKSLPILKVDDQYLTFIEAINWINKPEQDGM